MSLVTTSGLKYVLETSKKQTCLSSLRSILLIVIRDEHLLGEMCRAWLEDDLSKCSDNKQFNILGAVGIVLAQMVYYYIRSEGRYYHATQKGAKRDLQSVQWDIDPEDITWPETPPDAEEVKRAIVLLDETDNELARSEKRAVVELDEAGNELSDSEQ